MSSLKNTNSSSMKSQQPTNQQQQTKPSSSYDVFAHVDAMVAKPVYGSDGASRWQAFQSTSSSSTGTHNNKSTSLSSFQSAAPKAPLKKLDRAVGFTSWQQERQHEESIRATSDAAPLNAGYIHFHKKQQQQQSDDRKRIQAIKDRKRPDNKQYYLPADTFEGWKFDYVFTTRDVWGTGYFWDGMDSLKELSAAPDSNKKRSTTTTEGDDDEKISTNNNITKKKQKKHKQQAAPAAVVIRDDPTHPLEQVMAAIQRRTQQQQQQQQQPLHASSASSSTANGMEAKDHGWESATDPASGKTYYYHRVTGERSWEKPLLNDHDNNNNNNNNDKNPTISSLPSGWKSAVDANSGKEYYYHEETGQTTWERPRA